MINLQFSTQQYKVPESFGKYLHEYLKKANTYHTQPQELIKKISEKYGINSKNLFLTAGADEAILAISNEFGEKTHIFTPTYVEYTNAERFGYKVIRENSFNNGSYEIDTNQKNASLIFLANPGNPIGETSREKIIDLIENNQQAIVVIDEVYHEYSPNLTVIDLIEKYDNLIVLRSFSKSFGMAGIRLGFAVSQEKNLKRIADKVQWANVSYLSVAVGIAVLEEEKFFNNLRNEVLERKKDFADFLETKSFKVIKGSINAVLLEFNSEEAGRHFYLFLKKNGVLTSLAGGESNTGLDERYIRITIGTEDQMKKVRKIISKYKGNE